MSTPLEQAKARLSVPALWQQLGLPGKPGANCRSPFRQDRRPSFSVFANGERWHDFATGEQGDAVDFLAAARQLDKSEAARELIRLAGMAPPPRPVVEARRPLQLPPLSPGSPDQHRRLAELRGLAVEGIALAAQRGLLRFGTWHGRAAWFVLDSTQRNVQARRLDGKMWQEIESKGWSLHGSTAAWPLGIREAAPFSAVALVEGGPDLLAACHFAWCEDREVNVASVAILGASLSIHPDALPLFASKRVRIFAHDDASGQTALRRWAGQLRTVRAMVDAMRFTGLRRFDGAPVNDLCDFANLDADDFENDRQLWRILP